MKYLIFSELNRNHFFFLSYFIITIIKDFINRYIASGRDIIFKFNQYYIYSLSDFLSIIPFIIIKVRSKGISKNDKESLTDNIRESSLSIKYIYTDINKKRKKRIIKLSILVSMFDFLALYLNVSFDIIIKSSNFIIKSEKINSMILFNILSKYVLSIIILHSAIYKHHYLSLAFNFLFLVGLVIYDIISISEAKTYLNVLMKA